MAPKGQKKRGAQDEDASSARHAKKAGRNKRELTYDTYEEALDGMSCWNHDLLPGHAELINRWCRLRREG